MNIRNVLYSQHSSDDSYIYGQSGAACSLPYVHVNTRVLLHKWSLHFRTERYTKYKKVGWRGDCKVNVPAPCALPCAVWRSPAAAAVLARRYIGEEQQLVPEKITAVVTDRYRSDAKRVEKMCRAPCRRASCVLPLAGGRSGAAHCCICGSYGIYIYGQLDRRQVSFEFVPASRVHGGGGLTLKSVETLANGDHSSQNNI